MKKIMFTLALLFPVMAFCQQSTFNQDVLGMLGRNEQQILSLGEAIPADKFDWRPAEGVRSVGETMLHMASTNYYLMMNMGYALPSGVDLTKMESVTGKDQVLKVVKDSFAFVKENAPKVKEESLSDKVKLSFGEFSKRSIMLIILEHSGEHKGQLIGYARMNKITPPWSM